MRSIRMNRLAAASLPYIVIGVCVIVVIAALGYIAYGFLTKDDDKDNGATATIYIEDQDGNVFKADVNIGNPTQGEQFMLDMGQSIRKTSFQPLDTASSYTATSSTPLWQNGGGYKIWASVTFTISASNMKSVDSAAAYFEGWAGKTQTSGSPNHEESSNPLLTDGRIASVAVTKSSGIVIGSSMTISQDDSASGESDRFTQYYGSTYMPLTGDTVDGAYFAIDVHISGTGGDGNTMTAQATTFLSIQASAWQTNTLSVAITGASGGGF